MEKYRKNKKDIKILVLFNKFLHLCIQIVITIVNFNFSIIFNLYFLIYTQM